MRRGRGRGWKYAGLRDGWGVTEAALVQGLRLSERRRRQRAGGGFGQGERAVRAYSNLQVTAVPKNLRVLGL